MFWTLSFLILAITLLLRATRCGRVKDHARWFEKFAIWGTVHVHHAYPGMLAFLYGWLTGSSDSVEIGLALVVSDLSFHTIAHTMWGDPWWD